MLIWLGRLHAFGTLSKISAHVVDGHGMLLGVANSVFLPQVGFISSSAKSSALCG